LSGSNSCDGRCPRRTQPIGENPRFTRLTKTGLRGRQGRFVPPSRGPVLSHSLGQTKTPSVNHAYACLYRRCSEKSGEGGIRTRGTENTPYDGLANRCLQPLGHLSGVGHVETYRRSRAGGSKTRFLFAAACGPQGIASLAEGRRSGQSQRSHGLPIDSIRSLRASSLRASRQAAPVRNQAEGPYQAAGLNPTFHAVLRRSSCTPSAGYPRSKFDYGL
jgi:hypothetical protein